MIRLNVPGELRYRDVAVRVVSASCKLVGRGPEDGRSSELRRFTEHVISACGEAFNNVAVHAYGNRPKGDVELEIEPDADGIRVTVRDHGASWDPLAMPLPDLDSLPEGGYGIYIITSFMDDVAYRAGTPNELVMNKAFKSTSRLATKPRGTMGQGGGAAR